MYALLDGNNFYVSCHRVFDPNLRGKPVICLSNNDGNAVARSDEAKALGIKMGEPYFKVKHLEREAGLIALSANFALYGDMSDRMMSLAAPMGVSQERYSIDECFLDCTGVRDLTHRALVIRDRILRGLDIPTCVGIAPTKTLAKLANMVAKDSERKPGSYPAQLMRVCNLAELSEAEVEDLLRRTAVGDVWGVGSRFAKRLAEMDVATALDLRNMPVETARSHFGVVLERTIRELRGMSCIPMELAPPPKQQIACTRSFGRPVYDLEPLLEAVSHFAQRAAEKLRKGAQRAGAVYVFAHTSRFDAKTEPFSGASTVQLHSASSDTSTIVRAAQQGVLTFFRPGYKLTKAGVMLMDLSACGVDQPSLFEPPVNERDRSALMEALDSINEKYGKGCVTVGSAFTSGAWKMRQQRITPVYTADVGNMPVVN